MAYWNTRGLRGSAFEDLINMTNQLYYSHGLAVVQKVPTPITPVSVDNTSHTISCAYFGEKSTVDYIGAVQGFALCFDAKETQTKNLPLRNIHPHQMDFMKAFQKQKGVAFILVQFHATREIFYVSYDMLQNHFTNAARQKRKSIAYADFDPKYRVYNKAGYPVHYLEAVQLYITAGAKH